MSIRKRKFSGSTISRSPANKSRNSVSASAMDDEYKSIILNIIDTPICSPREELKPVNQTSNITTVEIADHICSSNADQSSNVNLPEVNPQPPNQAIPLPPPLPESNLKAAGILAELITLRGCQVNQGSEQLQEKGKNDISCNVISQASKPLIDLPLLERFPNKLPSGNTAAQSINVHPSGGVIVASKAATSNKKSSTALHTEEEDDDSRYLLQNLDNLNLSEKEKEVQNQEDVDRSFFIQELILSMLAEDCESATEKDSLEQLNTYVERATPIECPLLSSTPTHINEGSGISDSKPSTSNTNIDSKTSLPDKVTQRSSSSCVDESTDTGVGNSLLADNVASVVEFSISASNQQTEDGKVGDVSSTVTSRSAPTLGLATEEPRIVSNTSQWSYQSNHTEDEKDSDDDKPPSPTPVQQQQRHGLRIQGRVYASGSVRLAGGVSSTSPINNYGREDVATGSLTKNIR